MLLPFLLACTIAPGPDGASWPVLTALTLPSFTTEAYLPGGPDVESVAHRAYASTTTIVLTDHVNRCGESTDYLSTWAAASEALLDASDDGADVAAFCAGMPTLLAAVDAASARQAQVGHRLTLSLCTDCDSIDGAVDVPSDQVESVFLEADDAPEPVAYADAWDADACAFGEMEAPADVATWEVEGTLDLHAGAFGAYTGTLDATAVDPVEGADASLEPFKLDFSTSVCEPPDAPRLVVF